MMGLDSKMLLVASGATLTGVLIGYLVGKKRSLSWSRKSDRNQHPFTKYSLAMSLRLHPAQDKLNQVTLKHTSSRMLSSSDEMQLLGNLCISMGAKKTLDIGVFTGYSAMSIALALPIDGKVIACDISEEYPEIGRPYWKEAGVEDKIDLRIGSATETLQQLLDNGEAGTFDFMFIDADKTGYDLYYETGLKLLRKGGLIAIDNVWWNGKVGDEKFQDPDTKAIRALNKKIKTDERVDISMLPMADGVTLAWKR